MITPKPSVAGVERSAQPEASREAWLRLDRNEIVPEWGEDVFHAIISQLSPVSISAYPAVQPLYSALATHLSVRTSQILLGAGSDWLIRACFDTYCQPGDEVVLPVPTYGMYDVYARLNGANVVDISYRPDFSFPTDEVLEALERRPRLLGLASPNGAIGTAVGEADLRTIVSRARATDTVVVLDEAYVEYFGDGSLHLIHEHQNLVLIRTFSKAAGLAGLRVGYAVGHERIIDGLARVRPNVEVNQVGVVAATHLLTHSDVVARHVANTLAGKRLLADRLRACGIPVHEGDANFLLARFGARGPRVVAALHDAKVLVKPSPAEGVQVGWTRITVGPEGPMAYIADIVEQEMRDD